MNHINSANKPQKTILSKTLCLVDDLDDIRLLINPDVQEALKEVHRIIEESDYSETISFDELS